MQFIVDSKGKRTIAAFQDDVRCKICDEREWQTLHYCEQDDRLYCFQCHLHGKGCTAKRSEHIDWKIDRVEIIADDRHLRLNEEMLGEK